MKVKKIGREEMRHGAFLFGGSLPCASCGQPYRCVSSARLGNGAGCLAGGCDGAQGGRAFA
ncbi:MAG: hypothetical protein ACTTKG_04870 [Selenomonas sp.]